MATLLETVAEGIRTPSELEFRQSEIEPSLMGVYAKKVVRKGRAYGPFVGAKKDCDEVLDDTYSWEIRGPKGVRLYSIDASEPSTGNWMRYVKSARSYEEQNMIATQYKRNIYYRTLRAITPGEELLCWYTNLPSRKDGEIEGEISESTLNTSGESGKSDESSAKSDGEHFDLQMPILEKMDTSEMMPLELNSAMSAESESGAKVPAHLGILGQGEADDKVAEPPLISPIYPSDGHQVAAFSSITAGVDLGGLGEPDIQIQAPDVSSSDTTSQFLSAAGDLLDANDADSTSLSEANGLTKDVPRGKNRTKAVTKRRLNPPAVAPVKKRTRVGQKVAKKFLVETKRQNTDDTKDSSQKDIARAVIGPDCVSVLPDGTELFGCQFCSKKCRFPNGLKLHLMLKHHIRKIIVQGVNTSKWGKGLGPGDIKHTKKKPAGKKVELNKESPAKTSEEETISTKKSPASSPKEKAKKGVFVCHLCNRCFMYATWRDKHVLRHGAEVNKAMFLCPDCPRRFVTEGDLTKHRLTHRTKPLNHIDEPLKSEPKEEDYTVAATRDNQLNSNTVADSSPTERKIDEKDTSLRVPVPGRVRQVEEAIAKPLVQVKRRNVTNRKGHLKKVASCKLCGIEFVSSSNLHRHLRRRHGLHLPRKRAETVELVKVQDVKKEDSAEVTKSVESIKTETPLPPRPPCARETVLNIPQVSSFQTKGHMKTMASMTRLIRRKHATAVLQNMVTEKKIGGDNSKGNQNHMRAKLFAALRQTKNTNRRNQGFRKIELVALKQHKEVPSVICPWQSDVRPRPYVPKKPPSSDLRHTRSYPGPSTSNVEVLDLSIRKSKNDGRSSVCYATGDSSQPLDLSCHSRTVVDVPTYKPPAKFRKVTPPYSDHKSITRFNITPRMKSTGWKSSTLSNPLDSLDQERTTKFSVLDAAITCNVCQLPFDSMKLLTQHVVAHAEDYPYKCEFCVKLFETTDTLATHRFELHRVGKMFCCSECQQEFAYLSNLKQHQVDMHTDEMCSYIETGPEEIRPQNFTDPTKAIQTPPILPESRGRISLIAHEMSKAKVSSPKLNRMSSPSAQPTKRSPRKQSKKKDVPCNPQRHHPFAHAREIGYLSIRQTDVKQSSAKSVSHYNMATNNRCTKCSRVFPSTAELHVHIMECASSSLKPKSPGKSPIKSPVKTPIKLPEKKPQQPNLKAHKLKLQAVRKSRSKAVQKANEAEDDGSQKPKRARPGLKMYNPLNHTRRRASANIDDAHSCQGCGKKFHFINGLERHMKLCPNKDKLFSNNKSRNLVPQNMNHQCAYCARQFVYLRSLKKHISSCPVRPANAPTTVPSLIVHPAATATPAPAAAASSIAVAGVPMMTEPTATCASSKATTVLAIVCAAAAQGKGAMDLGRDNGVVGNAEQMQDLLSGVKPPGSASMGVQPGGGGEIGMKPPQPEMPVTTINRKSRRRRRRADPYGKKRRRSRSSSPRSARQLEAEEAGDEEDEEEEVEEEGEEEEGEEEEEVEEGGSEEAVVKDIAKGVQQSGNLQPKKILGDSSDGEVHEGVCSDDTKLDEVGKVDLPEKDDENTTVIKVLQENLSEKPTPEDGGENTEKTEEKVNDQVKVGNEENSEDQKGLS